MISLTELREELGTRYQFDGDEEQVRVLDKDGFDITFIDLDSGIIEHEITVKWGNNEKGLQPDAADLALEAVGQEMRDVWENAGFVVAESGSMGTYWYKKEPDINLPVYNVSVTKEVKTVKEAADTVRWIRCTESTVWL